MNELLLVLAIVIFGGLPMYLRKVSVPDSEVYYHEDDNDN